jgi:hypothetical protein
MARLDKRSESGKRRLPAKAVEKPTTPPLTSRGAQCSRAILQRTLAVAAPCLHHRRLQARVCQGSYSHRFSGTSHLSLCPSNIPGRRSPDQRTQRMSGTLKRCQTTDLLIAGRSRRFRGRVVPYRRFLGGK